MRKIGAWVVYALVFFAAISCVSNEKVIYLQNLENNQPINEGELISYEIPEYRLQYNDIIDYYNLTISLLL